MKILSLICVVITLLAGCATTGVSPQVGDLSPDFSLIDVSGNEVHLSDYRGKKKVVLIFYTLFKHLEATNSCLIQLQNVQNRIDRIKKLDAEVIAISTMGDQQDVSWMRDSNGITFTLIPKPNKNVAQDYGVWNRTRNFAAATIIIDKKGRIRFKENAELELVNLPWYGHRTSVNEIISQLEGI